MLSKRPMDEPSGEIIQDLCCYLAEAGMAGQAVMLLKQLVARRPDQAWAHVLLGKCLCEVGNLEDALDAFLQAMDQNENLIDARFHAGLTAKSLGDFSQALNHFSEVILLNSKDARAYNLMGECCAELGLNQDAALFFAQARRIAPDFKEPLKNLEKLWDENGIDDGIIEPTPAMTLVGGGGTFGATNRS